MLLQECGHNFLLSHSVDQPHDIGWCGGSSGGDRVDGLGQQDGGVALLEGVGLSTGKTVSIDGCRKDEAQGGNRGCHGY